MPQKDQSANSSKSPQSTTSSSSSSQSLPPLKSSRSKSYLVKVHFGEPLDSDTLPEFIIQAMDFLLKHAKDIEGLFRISGHAGDVSKLKSKLNAGEAIELSEIENIHNVASLVKMYFRELPNPLISFECYDMFMIADSIPDDCSRLECLKKLLVYLPPTNQIILQQLCLFLSELAKNSEKNRMNIENLAIVFSPNILRAPDSKQDDPLLVSHPFLECQEPLSQKEIVQSYKSAQNIVKSLIEHVDYFFSSNLMNFQDFIEQQLSNERKQGSSSNTTLTSPIQMQISEQIFGTSPHEVTSSVKRLSEKITQQIQDFNNNCENTNSFK
ncbi:hypothetical protein C9374_003516 [Naegleria lovaniensis]|uniref:Rho-GAP domain-containing protein n=1 Tax=Naegleria lovaniensis TaxID=51637 RepID=A0AA88GTV2_NAELO|nr:uncharacterized protein C9374_003516 [Naegleria lovaniensis]KAG2385701.1 hypothetical protein C9374_003516 [Naegleria lovaniensis]